MKTSFSIFSLALVLLVCVPAAVAVEPKHTADALDAKALAFPQLAPNYDQALVDAYLKDAVWTAWNASKGGKWTAQYDTLTAKPRRVWGGAIPWVPGKANSLSGTATAADLERVAREFIAANQSVLPAGNERLTFVAEIADPTPDGSVRYAAFDYDIAGVPVESGRLIFAVNNGNMIYWHASNIASVPTVTTPSISADAAVAAVLSYAGVRAADAEVVDRPRLKLMPRNAAAGELLIYQLIYETSFRVAGSHVVWGAYVDAATGAVVAFGDLNRYAESCTTKTSATGRVTGGIRPAEATDAEVVRSFPLVRVDTATAPVTTTQNGLFTFGGGTVSSGMNGTFFDVNCVDCVKSEQEPVAEFQPFVFATNGRLDFGTGGQDVVANGKTTSFGNGTSTPADRTAFFHTNVARAMAKKWLTLPWLESNMPVNVNINDVCNAFWNGISTNFFKKGVSGAMTCNNTGEIRDVMQHEWGHGLDDNDGWDPGYALGFGDRATGEAYGDHIALFVDHDSCIGQSFAAGRKTGPFQVDPDTGAVRECDGVRNVDELRALRGNLNTVNVQQKCGVNPLYAGALGRQGHCEGEIYGQAGYHLVQSLISGRQYGTVTLDSNKQHQTYGGDPIPNGPDGSPNPAIDRDLAWTIHERLFYVSRPLSGSYAPSRFQAIGPSVYDAYFVVDDEGDGLHNGTPHGAYLNDAFVHHGMEEYGLPGGRPAGIDAANCAGLAAPAVTLTQSIDGTTGTPAVTASWPAVSGAASYTVLRTERRNDVFLEVGRTSGTSLTDVGVDNGVTYIYRVQANGGGSCYTGSPAGLATISVSQGEPRFKGVTVTDSPGGNGDGGLDAGEKASLYVVLTNSGLEGLTNVTATLVSTTAGVTVASAQATRSYGSIVAGGSAGPNKSFVVNVDSIAALCGSTANFVLTISSDQGCFVEPFLVPIGNDGTSCVVFKEANPQPTSAAVTSDSGNTSCGDGDGVPDPGETIQVSVDVHNTGTKTANGVSVTLSVDKPYFTFVGSRTVDLGSIAAQGTETKKAVFTLSVGNAPFNDRATFTATTAWTGSSGQNSLSSSTFVNRDKVKKTFSYDFESGEQGWTPSAAEQGWIRTLAPATGNVSTLWHSQYAPSTCLTLTSPVFEFSSTSALAFDLAFISENLDPVDAAYDGIDVQISTDGGASWHKLEPEPGYNAPSAGSGCVTKDTGFFSGYSPLMTRYGIDLSAYSGSTGQVRFRWSADPLAEVPVAGGAFVDNVTARDIVTPVPSASCQ